MTKQYKLPHGDYTSDINEWSDAWYVYKKAAEGLGFTVRSFSPGITLGGTNEYGWWSFNMPIEAFDMFMRTAADAPPAPRPTCGSDCDELIKAEREIEGLQKSLNAAKMLIRSNDARQKHEGAQAEALRLRADDVAGERAANAALTDEVQRLRKGHERYETARRMPVRLWADAWKTSMETGRSFDEIIDEWRPHFYRKK